jgi:hypothetical protein
MISKSKAIKALRRLAHDLEDEEGILKSGFEGEWEEVSLEYNRRATIQTHIRDDVDTISQLIDEIKSRRTSIAAIIGVANGAYK